MKFIVSTAPPDASLDLVRTLLDEELVGGCNIIPGLRSLYRWRGVIQDEPEELMLFETTEAACDAAMARLEEIHPYEVPKLVALDASEVNAAYEAWLEQVVRDPRLRATDSLDRADR